MVYETYSEAETVELAQKLAQELIQKNHIFTLSGDLGAGKTTFVKGFAQGLGITESVISPTFVLIRQHQRPDFDQILFHIDLYRLDQQAAVNQLGLKDLFEDPQALVLIEWPEKLPKLPVGAVEIKIEKLSADRRKISIY